jgi:hypothetical protein
VLLLRPCLQLPSIATIGNIQAVMGIMYSSTNFNGMTNLMSVMPVVSHLLRYSMASMFVLWRHKGLMCMFVRNDQLFFCTCGSAGQEKHSSYVGHHSEELMCTPNGLCCPTPTPTNTALPHPLQVGYERVVFYRERAASMYNPFAYGFAMVRGATGAV